MAKTILIIEDEAILRRTLHKECEDYGFTVLEAENGKIGLARANEAHPDLILLDLMMPEMNGAEVLAALRQDEVWGKHVPVIVLTNTDYEEKEIGLPALHGEPAFYCKKNDMTMEQIMAKVSACLGSNNP